MEAVFRWMAVALLVTACHGVTLDDLAAQLKDIQTKVDLLAVEQLESEVNDVTFFSSTGCASATPAASLPLTATPGVPNGVSGRAQCAMHCENLDGCKAYNHRSVALADGTQCELYTKIPAPLEFADAAGCTFYRGTDLIERPTYLVQQNDGKGTMFQKTWAEYKAGFGDKTGNYWIGNDRLHAITKDGSYKMKIRMQAAYNQQWYWAEYTKFVVAGEEDNYKLSVDGYSGTAGDGMAYHNGMAFSTVDKDHDLSTIDCAQDTTYGAGAGFWYNSCQTNTINSPNLGNSRNFDWNKLPVGTASVDWQLLYTRVTLVRM